MDCSDCDLDNPLFKKYTRTTLVLKKKTQKKQDLLSYTFMLRQSTYQQTNTAVLFDGAAIIHIYHLLFGGQNESAFRNKK